MLHGHVGAAFTLHPLLVLSMPYLVVGFVLEYTGLRTRFALIRERFYGLAAARICAGIVLAFWSVRLLLMG